MEVTPGTPDVKSGPMRCQKGLRTPFRLLSQDFRMEDRVPEIGGSELFSE